MLWRTLLVGSITLLAGAAGGQSPRAPHPGQHAVPARLTISITVVPVTYHAPRPVARQHMVQYRMTAPTAMETLHERQTVVLKDAETARGAAPPLPVVLETTTIVPR
jgi:hypothetical protein